MLWPHKYLVIFLEELITRIIFTLFYQLKLTSHTQVKCQTTTICVYRNFHMMPTNISYGATNDGGQLVIQTSSFNSIDLISYDASFRPVYARPE